MKVEDIYSYPSLSSVWLALGVDVCRVQQIFGADSTRLRLGGGDEGEREEEGDRMLHFSFAIQ